MYFHAKKATAADAPAVPSTTPGRTPGRGKPLYVPAKDGTTLAVIPPALFGPPDDFVMVIGDENDATNFGNVDGQHVMDVLKKQFAELNRLHGSMSKVLSAIQQSLASCAAAPMPPRDEAPKLLMDADFKTHMKDMMKDMMKEMSKCNDNPLDDDIGDE